MYRFFVDKKSFIENKVIIKEENLIHQIKNVLRLKIGQQIVLLDNTGFEYLVNLEKIEKETIEGFVLKKEKNKNEPKVKVTLLQSLLKHNKFEQVLKFGTSIGVNSFIPIVTQRSIVRTISFNKLIRYKRIIKESAEESGRGILPKIEKLMFFKEINFFQKKDGLKLIAWEKEKKRKISSLANKIKKAKEIYLIIGPEGGLTPEEVLWAKKNGFLSFSLGKLILRSEIAGLVALSLIFHYNKTI